MLQRTPVINAPSVVKQIDEKWPQPGQWTYKDYLCLPDDGNRYEIIRVRLF